MPWTVASPSPVPLPRGLVVKKGSNRCSLASGESPTPVSRTLSRTHSPGCRASPVASTLAVSMVRVPPPGMASRAFTDRLTMTCSSCPGSKRASQRPGWSTIRNSTAVPTSLRSSFPVARTVSLTSSETSETSCFRAKVSSCRVSVRARPAAKAISSTTSASTGRFWPPSSLSDSAQPMITVSRLLKSWATPPASWPMASSLDAWWRLDRSRSRSASARLRSVMSRVMESTRLSPRRVKTRAETSPGTTSPFRLRKVASRFWTQSSTRSPSVKRFWSAGAAQSWRSMGVRPMTSAPSQPVNRVKPSFTAR
jgi:hypothetical protein